MDADIYHSNISDGKIKKLEELIQLEADNELLYKILIGNAPTKEDENLIKSIQEDKCKHKLLIKKIYKDFKDDEDMLLEEETLEIPMSYIEGIKKAALWNLLSIDKYNDIMEDEDFQLYKDELTNIAMKELKNSLKFNYLLFANNPVSNPQINEEFSIDKITKLLDEWIKELTPAINKVVSDFNKDIDF